MKKNIYTYLIIIFFIILILLNIYYRKQRGVLDKLESKEFKYNLFANKLKPVIEPKKIDLEEVLDKYNKLLKPIYLENIARKYHYSKGNFNTQTKEICESIIKELFNVINNYSYTKYKLYDIDNITEYKSSVNNRLIQCQFLIHEVEQHFTRKLNIEFVVNKDNTISINYIRFASQTHTLMSEPKVRKLENEKRDTKDYLDMKQTLSLAWNTSIHPFYYNYNKAMPAWVQISGQFKNDIDTLHKVCYTQEPCKYDLNVWDTHGVNKQSKLKENCNIINHSDRILKPEPYVNPTLFSIDS